MVATKKHIVCMKIGGSVITDKTVPFTINQAGIDRFAEIVAQLQKDLGSSVDFLLGNGVGSFGHFPAHKHGLRSGAQTNEQWLGAAITHNHVRDINLAMANALNKLNVPAFCLSPGDVCISKNGSITHGSGAVVKELLGHGIVPLFHGDTIYDSVKGVHIISTERALLWFGKTLRSTYERITFIAVTQTGGVLDNKAAVITELARSAAIPTLPGHTHDVTGGMANKVALLREAADWADAAYIVSNSRTDIQQALAHRQAGTKIL